MNNLRYDIATYRKTKHGKSRLLTRDEFRSFRDMIAHDVHDQNRIDDKLNVGYTLKSLFGTITRED